MKKILFIFFILPLNLYSIGSLSFGVALGLHPNINNISNPEPMDAGGDKSAGRVMNIYQESDYVAKTHFYNKLIATSDGKGEQFLKPQAFDFGWNTKYVWNSVLIRIGLEYSSLMIGKTASFTPKGGKKNTITFSTYSGMVPVTFAFLLKLTHKHHFYMGIGPMYNYASVKVTNSRPKELQKALSTSQQDLAYKSFSYSGGFMGFHFISGIEVPLGANYSFSAEWMIFTGRSALVLASIRDVNGNKKSDSRGQTLQADGQKFTFGINYWMSL